MCSNAASLLTHPKIGNADVETNTSVQLLVVGFFLSLQKSQNVAVGLHVFLSRCQLSRSPLHSRAITAPWPGREGLSAGAQRCVKSLPRTRVGRNVCASVQNCFILSANLIASCFWVNKKTLRSSPWCVLYYLVWTCIFFVRVALT